MKVIYFVLTFLIFFAHNSYGIGGGCRAYLSGNSNPEIPRFGGEQSANPIQEMANVLLDFSPKDSKEQVQVAVPVHLEFNPQQPEQFGDGQKNAFATYGALPKAPFVAVLTRSKNPQESSELALIPSRFLPGYESMSGVEVSILDQTFKLPLDSRGVAQLPVNLEKLAWNQVSDAKPVFFRPAGWSDWFAVQFPNPYISIDTLVNGMDESSRTLPDGRSIVDPLGVKNAADPQAALRQIDESQGFPIVRVDRVHGVYQPNVGSPILTSNGGVWTRYRIEESFKIVYLVKDPRSVEAEVRDGVVSGTGPHFIGANAEIILNSLGQENLMTFYGITAPAVGPNGGKLAWDLTHQWIGTWLQPGQAFVTPQGSYHWHLNHLAQPVAAQVLTPPEVPSPNNHFGFPKQK